MALIRARIDFGLLYVAHEKPGGATDCSNLDYTTAGSW